MSTIPGWTNVKLPPIQLPLRCASPLSTGTMVWGTSVGSAPTSQHHALIRMYRVFRLILGYSLWPLALWSVGVGFVCIGVIAMHELVARMCVKFAVQLTPLTPKQNWASLLLSKLTCHDLGKLAFSLKAWWLFLTWRFSLSLVFHVLVCFTVGKSMNRLYNFCVVCRVAVTTAFGKLIVCLCFLYLIAVLSYESLFT